MLKKELAESKECIEVIANFSDAGWSHFGFYDSVKSACRFAEKQLIEIQGLLKSDIEIRTYKLNEYETTLDPAMWGK